MNNNLLSLLTPTSSLQTDNIDYESKKVTDIMQKRADETVDTYSNQLEAINDEILGLQKTNKPSSFLDDPVFINTAKAVMMGKLAGLPDNMIGILGAQAAEKGLREKEESIVTQTQLKLQNILAKREIRGKASEDILKNSIQLVRDLATNKSQFANTSKAKIIDVVLAEDKRRIDQEVKRADYVDKMNNDIVTDQTILDMTKFLRKANTTFEQLKIYDKKTWDNETQKDTAINVTFRGMAQDIENLKSSGQVTDQEIKAYVGLQNEIKSFIKISEQMGTPFPENYKVAILEGYKIIFDKTKASINDQLNVRYQAAGISPHERRIKGWSDYITEREPLVYPKGKIIQGRQIQKEYIGYEGERIPESYFYKEEETGTPSNAGSSSIVGIKKTSNKIKNVFSKLFNKGGQ